MVFRSLVGLAADINGFTQCCDGMIWSVPAICRAPENFCAPAIYLTTFYLTSTNKQTNERTGDASTEKQATNNA